MESGKSGSKERDWCEKRPVAAMTGTEFPPHYRKSEFLLLCLFLKFEPLPFRFFLFTLPVAVAAFTP